jgi:hypothetical protein
MCGTATPCVVDNPSRTEKMRVKTKTKRVDHKHPKQIIGSERASYWSQPTNALAFASCGLESLPRTFDLFLHDHHALG